MITDVSICNKDRYNIYFILKQENIALYKNYAKFVVSIFMNRYNSEKLS